MRALLCLVGLALGALVSSAYAQVPGVSQEVLARGRVEYAAEVDGPAGIYVVWIRPGPRANSKLIARPLA